MNFFSIDPCSRWLKITTTKFQNNCIWISGLFQGFPGSRPFSRTFKAWKSQFL